MHYRKDDEKQSRTFGEVVIVATGSQATHNTEPQEAKNKKGLEITYFPGFGGWHNATRPSGMTRSSQELREAAALMSAGVMPRSCLTQMCDGGEAVRPSEDSEHQTLTSYMDQMGKVIQKLGINSPLSGTFSRMILFGLGRPSQPSRISLWQLAVAEHLCTGTITVVEPNLSPSEQNWLEGRGMQAIVNVTPCSPCNLPQSEAEKEANLSQVCQDLRPAFGSIKAGEEVIVYNPNCCRRLNLAVWVEALQTEASDIHYLGFGTFEEFSEDEKLNLSAPVRKALEKIQAQVKSSASLVGDKGNPLYTEHGVFTEDVNNDGELEQTNLYELFQATGWKCIKYSSTRPKSTVVEDAKHFGKDVFKSGFLNTPSKPRRK